MNIGESVYLDLYRSVGDEVGRGNDERVGIDFGVEVGSVDGVGVELEAGY